MFDRTDPGAHVLGSSSTSSSHKQSPRGAYSHPADGSTTSTLLSEIASESMYAWTCSDEPSPLEYSSPSTSSLARSQSAGFWCACRARWTASVSPRG